MDEFDMLAHRIAAMVVGIYWESEPIIWEQERETGDELEALLQMYNDMQTAQRLTDGL